jgi:alpha-L-fucosidase 2
MLVQSFGDIELLPALPKVWPTGSIHGLRARGGYDVDLQWKDRGLVSATIRSVNGGKRNVRYGEKVVALELKPGQAARFDQNLARVSTRPS